MLKINFKKQVLNPKMILTKEDQSYLNGYYVKNYNRVLTAITDDEYVGQEYNNLCIIEQMNPKVKLLRR